MTDPRVSIIDERMKGVRHVIAVSSGKGGVGKSLIATTLALTLAEKGHRIGLFDIDFTSPSTHIIMGIRDVKPKEDRGIVPPRVHSLKYMSIVYYSGDCATPLRGSDVSNALIELLSTTRWGQLDFLIIDMPPGIGDATLDLVRLMRGIRFIIVTTPSRLAFETVRKLTGLLSELKIPIIGIVENMRMGNLQTVQKRTQSLGLAYIGGIPYDKKVEETIGDKTAFLKTLFAKKVAEIGTKIAATVQ